MSEPKHTPGPWKHRNGRIYHADQEHLTIASVARAWDGDCSPANGELLAAAPCLLEALEGAQRALARRIETDQEEKVSTCVSSRGRSGNPDCTCGFCERVKAEANARALIARLKGETE